ncbi:TetR/AcrR family transcriptional regulator [Actinomadura flavalba]|uniref:TetR/AcrR family transcriptional regulator n=1 Tax=Actinomadura flavalba TaxID=1120938 RepID=UPI00035E0762|nr:TetR/AcrR family transcriptional regulator [Actinomadura flavalba]
MPPRTATSLHRDGRSLRDHLIATAERLITARGTTGLTVRAIAREANVAVGLLYNHFEDKEELLALAMRAYLTSAQRSLPPLPAPADVPLDDLLRAHIAHGTALHAAILPALAGLTTQPEVLRRLAALPSPDPDWRHRLAADLAAARDLGRIAPDVDVTAATTLIVGACHEPVVATLLGAPSPPPPNVDTLVTTILTGLRPRPT